MTYKLNFLCLLVCAITSMVFVPMFAFASYSVAPLVVDHELEKRDMVTETITITNNGTSLLRLYPTVNEISVDEGGKVQTFVEPAMVEDRTTSITSWIEISRARIELAPGESKELELSIKVNPDVASGEYHAFVGFPEGSNRPEAEKRVYEGSAPGTVVRIGVDKVQNQFLRLDRFSVEKFVKSATDGLMSYVLNNPGEDPVIPRGEIIIYDNNGIEVTTVPINPEGAVINGKAQMDFSAFVPSNIPMGKYKAFLSVEYGEHQTASVHDTAFFYVLPIWNLIIIFAIVLAIALAIALYVHRKYDLAGEVSEADSVAMYIRQGTSEGKEHDIDLTQKN
jgi:hypothetical protein